MHDQARTVQVRPQPSAQVSPLWAEPEHPNLATALGGYISSGAPLVAGFELAAVVLMLTSQHVAQYVPLAGPAVAAMIASAALMVSSLRYGFWAVSYWTTPDERLMWDPAAVVSSAALRRERFMLAGRMTNFQKLRRRAERFFEVGLILFLLAICIVLVPDHWRASGPAWRWIAAAVAGLAFLFHLAWSAGNWLHHRFGTWHDRLVEQTGTDTNRARFCMKFVERADKVLVTCLAVIWPPVGSTRFDEPGEPEVADLLGIRRS